MPLTDDTPGGYLPSALAAKGNRFQTDTALVPAPPPLPGIAAATTPAANTADYTAGQAAVTPVNTGTGRELLVGGLDMSFLGNNRPNFNWPSTAIEDPAAIPNIDTRALSGQAENFISSIERPIPDFMPVYDKVKQERMQRFADDMSSLGINASRQKQNIADMRAGPVPQYGTPGTVMGDLSQMQGEMFRKAYDFALNNVDTQSAGAEVHLRDVMNQTLDKAMGDVAHTYFQGSVDQALKHPDLVLQALQNYTDAAKSDQATALGQNQIIGANRRQSADLTNQQATTQYTEQGLDARASQGIAATLAGKSIDFQTSSALQNARSGTDVSQFNVTESDEAKQFKANADNAFNLAQKAFEANNVLDYNKYIQSASLNMQLYQQTVQRDAKLAQTNAAQAQQDYYNTLDTNKKLHDDKVIDDATFASRNEAAARALEASQIRVRAAPTATEAAQQAAGTLGTSGGNAPSAQAEKTAAASTASLQSAFSQLNVSPQIANQIITSPSTAQHINVPAPNLTPSQKQTYLTGKYADGDWGNLAGTPDATILAAAGAVINNSMSPADADALIWNLAQDRAINSRQSTSSGTAGSSSNSTGTRFDSTDTALNPSKTGSSSNSLSEMKTKALTVAPADVLKQYAPLRQKYDDLMGTNQDPAVQSLLRSLVVNSLNQGAQVATPAQAGFH